MATGMYMEKMWPRHDNYEHDVAYEARPSNQHVSLIIVAENSNHS